MKSRLHSVVILFLFASALVHAQGFQAPSPGKAVIYFVRPSSAGFAISFDFYHNDKYIGDFAGRNYMRYETDPGEHLFWASSENHEFLTAEIKEGGVYVVLVEVEMGFAIARVGLLPVSATDKAFDRVKKLVDKKGPKETSQGDVSKRNELRVEYIQDKVKNYHEKWKETRTYKHLSADMAIPLNL